MSRRSGSHVFEGLILVVFLALACFAFYVYSARGSAIIAIQDARHDWLFVASGDVVDIASNGMSAGQVGLWRQQRHISRTDEERLSLVRDCLRVVALSHDALPSESELNIFIPFRDQRFESCRIVLDTHRNIESLISDLRREGDLEGKIGEKAKQLMSDDLEALSAKKKWVAKNGYTP